MTRNYCISLNLMALSSEVKKQDLNKKIGKRIVEMRKKKGLSQSELARACEKDRQWIDRLEKGRTTPTIYSLHLVAGALEEPMIELVKI
jgi:transcriptional regulator with XRE-family HTH domain